MTAPAVSSTAAGRRPRDRRRQILSGAADLFAARGFAAVSVQEIGQATGISGAAVYRHFAGKDALLEELVLDDVATLIEVSRAAGDAARRTGASALDAMVAAAVDQVVERGGSFATSLRERHRLGGGAEAEVRAGERELAHCWGAAITEVRPELDRRAVVAREAAVYGVLAGLSRRPEVLAQPRARAVVTDGLVALASTPAGPAPITTKPAARRWAPPVTRRQEILGTAMALFAARGFHGVGLNEVGEALGIAGPSIYEHFDGKQQLLLDAYDQAGSMVSVGATAAVERAASADDALDGLVASFVEVAFDRVDLIAVTTREGGSLPPEERPRLVRRRRELHDLWGAVVRELRPDLPAPDRRLLVRGAFPLVTQLAQLRRDRPSAPEAAALARAFVLGTPTAQEAPR